MLRSLVVIRSHCHSPPSSKQHILSTLDRSHSHSKFFLIRPKQTFASINAIMTIGNIAKGKRSKLNKAIDVNAFVAVKVCPVAVYAKNEVNATNVGAKPQNNDIA